MFATEVWVKDFFKGYDAWMKINKIWVPETNGSVPQMSDMNC